MSTYDIVITGAGPVGSLCALLLAPLGLKIAVIDRLTLEQVASPSSDGRTTAISWGSTQVMKAAGIWSSLIDYTTSIQEIRVSQSNSLGFLHFNTQDADGRPMGYIIENQVLRQILYDALQKKETVDIILEQSIHHIHSTPFHLRLDLKEEKSIETNLLIIAEGRTSPTREKLGFKSYRYDHQQTAVVTSVIHEYPHENKAFEHFLPTGPLAFLPIQTHQSSVVWSLKNAWAEAMSGLSPEDFTEELERRFPYLGRLQLMGERRVYPLHLLWARSVIGSRCALIGDAAHTLHPIAGQGANLGFRDAMTLATLIQKAAELGLDLGNDLLLKDYQRQRFSDNLSMALMTEGLVKIFSRKAAGLAFLRGQGMRFVNKCSWMRRRLTQHAMGIRL